MGCAADFKVGVQTASEKNFLHGVRTFPNVGYKQANISRGLLNILNVALINIAKIIFIEPPPYPLYPAGPKSGGHCPPHPRLRHPWVKSRIRSSFCCKHPHHIHLLTYLLTDLLTYIRACNSLGDVEPVQIRMYQAGVQAHGPTGEIPIK